MMKKSAPKKMSSKDMEKMHAERGPHMKASDMPMDRKAKGKSKPKSK